MNDLDDARKLWLEERLRFADYARLVGDCVSSALRPLGLWYEVIAREKTVESLIKKLIRKPNHSYETLPDKAGVRVVTRYRSDLGRVVEAIQSALHCGPADWKDQSPNEVGYASVHIDFARLPESHPGQKLFPVNHFWVELQVRTLAQHLWAELAHDSIYKNDETIQVLSTDVKRRVNLMAGQIEVADREFDRLGKETRMEDAVELLRFLESYYFALSSKKPDAELSLIILRKLLPLYGIGLDQVEARLKSFIEDKRSFLQKRFALAADGTSPPASPLFFQPEMLMIYERLQDDPGILRRYWSEAFPEKELEKIANDLGVSYQ
jgi:ppGpp synthetase/RelA/SpoT-type nucleotidyltranferase